MFALLRENDSSLCLESEDGHVRMLPLNLYAELAEVSDPYDPHKDFIGFVDPAVGVVLVNAKGLKKEKITSHHTPTKYNVNSPSDHKPTGDAAARRDTGNNDHLSSPASRSPRREKTMHQLAYEKKMGHSPPDDESRPISGFGVKKGKVIFNSSTFNSHDDEFHTEERTMGEAEQVKLTALICRLDEEYRKTSSKVCTLL